MYNGCHWSLVHTVYVGYVVNIWDLTINKSILKACLRFEGGTKSWNFHQISNYSRVIDCQVLMDPTIKWSINYSPSNVKLCKRFHLSSQTQIENSFPAGDSCRLGKFKWKRMTEQKKRNVKHFSLKGIRVPICNDLRHLFLDATILSGSFESCCILSDLFCFIM